MTPRSATPVPHGLSEDQHGLSEDEIAAEPMTQFARWMADALASGMPHAGWWVKDWSWEA